MVIRNGNLLTVADDTTLRAGDEVLLLSDPDNAPAIERLFTRPRQPHQDHPALAPRSTPSQSANEDA